MLSDLKSRRYAELKKSHAIKKIRPTCISVSYNVYYAFKMQDHYKSQGYTITYLWFVSHEQPQQYLLS